MYGNVEENKKLVHKYPWLLPRSRWTDLTDDEYDYSYTELDALPKGWRIAFGDMICEEIQSQLEKQGLVDKYRIAQIKEKYGELRWYDFGATSEIEQIINKYSVLSKSICMICGKPDTPMTGNYWIYPLCKDCFCSEEWSDDRQEKLMEEWIGYHMEQYPHRLPTSYTIITYDKDGKKKTTYDISQTAKDIRTAWYKANKNK